MKGAKLPVSRTRVYEADVILRSVVVNIRALDRDEATAEAKEMFWEQLAKSKERPEVSVVLRRLM